MILWDRFLFYFTFASGFYIGSGFNGLVEVIAGNQESGILESYLSPRYRGGGMVPV